ncbi:MAG: Rpn family recombination-promoting nuclease/putative transposase, partial [Verrucomicrobiaceae bacterium]
MNWPTPLPKLTTGFSKAVFSQPEHAVAFFRSHLPPELVEKIDWNTLTLVPGSFVKSSLRQAHSDLLFSVQMGGRQTLLYLLFEHQSTPDPAMPLRALVYVVEILNKHMEDHGLPLPAVLPFVFYQGPKAWTLSPDFEDLFDLPDDLKELLLPYLPKFRHALLDLTGIDPTEEGVDVRVQGILQLMKLARQKDLLGFFQWLAGLSADAFPDNLLRLMLLYAMRTDSDIDVETIYHTLSSNPELKKSAMSVAEKLEARGRREGRQEGAIQMLEDFLRRPVSTLETLDAMTA